MLANELFYVAVVPVFVAAVVTWICHRLRVAPARAWAAGIALGFVVGQLLIANRSSFLQAAHALVRPHEAVDWLPHAALLAAGIAVISPHAPRTWRHGWSLVLSAALAIALPLRLLAYSAYVSLRWSVLEKLGYAVLLAAIFALTWLLLASAQHERQGRLRTGLLIIVVAGAAVVSALSGALVYGQLCGVLTAAIVGTAAMSALAGSRTAGEWSLLELRQVGAEWHPSAAAGVVTCALGGLILLCSFYGGMTATNAALLFASLVMAAGRLPAAVAVLPPWQQGAIRVCLCVLPVALAVVRSVAAAQASMAAGPYAGL